MDTIEQVRQTLLATYPTKATDISQMIDMLRVSDRDTSTDTTPNCNRCGAVAYNSVPYPCCSKTVCAACRCDFGGRLYADGTTRCPGCFMVTDTLSNILVNIARHTRRVYARRASRHIA